MNSKTASDRSFGLVFATVFALIGLAPLRHNEAMHDWALGVALLLVAIALLRPAVLAPFNRVWTRFGLLLHHITTPIIMSILFFVTVTPIGLLMRLLGKRPLPLSFDAACPSYWVVRTPPGPDPASMQQQF